ncbi:hypothetical protein HMH01_03535 [Halovulum dunhuangense]|uniref:LysM domain-containing protein n=1 Tax=Halovulum dunhuangense TaxID=1505036 RepID=A0A849KR04_9RHOB|nr:hypothetical protein [Halovulum dunhuangense]NNU79503.1 hypothetical protein [Halovulum dunhuangense]
MDLGRAVRIATLALFALVHLPAVSKAEGTACPTHVVQRGETLRMIAEIHLGDRDRSGEIYAANRTIVGPDPNVIAPGLVLSIPCVAGRADPAADTMAAGPAPADPPPSPEPAAAPEPPPTAAPDVTRIDILTGAPFLPFVDPGHPSGGMIPEIVLAAFAATEGPPVEIYFVNDMPAHLDILLPRGGFAFSFPWLMPDCTEPQAGQTPLCRSFAGSASLYEQVTEFYALAGNAYAGSQAPADLVGARLCRPEGHPLRDLAEMGLLAPQITLIRRPGPADCLDAVLAGEADIASFDATVARSLIRGMRPEVSFVALERLSRIEQMRALALVSDRAGLAAIDRLGAGLKAIAESGAWFEIVERHLSLPEG